MVTGAVAVGALADTGVRVARNVDRVEFGSGSLGGLPGLVDDRRHRSVSAGGSSTAVYLVDEFFGGASDLVNRLGVQDGDHLGFVLTGREPTTDDVDLRVEGLLASGFDRPSTIVGIGGGSTLDTAKAVANLLTNGGKASDYQGWDLVRLPAVHKIGVPTISGTGSEATRTCVMINQATGLKLGMNSDHTVFDHLVLDPSLTATVPRDQYFFTGMDSYCHCIETLSGSFRNGIGDALSRETVELCRRIFLSEDMMSEESRERLMVASYLGGSAIAMGYVGLVHPFSAGLSVVLGLRHCVANCIALRALGEFYPEASAELVGMADRQGVVIPTGVCADLDDRAFGHLYDATVVHDKPLVNALGTGYREILDIQTVTSIFRRM